ncbi:equilibrative nucleoside transporter 1-like isoform X1 [Paramuricea clavata]|uniref:Equilibrative nucleoside transporter 1-like isoform X1 n=1 Tax=Paramuricea clavata TaxID=317549 RepID=A0A7D9HDZ7_PARCT|nr:equilibrative nucleoside transporter 1-like isoform X1 [Paramuricea clavata]
MDDQDESVQGLIDGQTKPPKDRPVVTIVVTSNGTKIKEDIPRHTKLHDRFNVVYLIIVLQGIGTLLPWNFFITAHTYFSTKLDGTRYKHEFENFFALAAFGPNLVAFFLNTMFKHKVALKIRILVPLFVMTGIFVVTAALVKVDTENWKGSFFAITLVTMGLINAFCAVYQGGLFGLSGMMPPRYTQALMTGQGIGGIFACVADIGSKLGTSDPIRSAFWYFLTAVVVLFACIVSYLGLYRIKFSQHFLEDHREQVQVAGRTSIQPDGFSDSGKPILTDPVEKDLAEYEVKIEKTTPPFAFIMKEIWRTALAVFLVFMVTLAAFPAVLSGIKSENHGDGSQWTGKYFTAVVCFLIFNVGDFCGRVTAGFVQKPGKDGFWLLGCCVLRFVFLPLFAFCNFHPRRTNGTVLFAEDYWPIIFNVLFSVSNGYLGSLCMMYGPKLVESKYAETAGTMMAYFLSLGLGIGAATSFGITKSI